MKTFFKCVNNGTIAVVEGPTYEAIEEWRFLPEWVQIFTAHPGPIFTFINAERHGPESHLWNYVTGSTELMDKLLKDHVVANRTFYVPFSNCSELNDDGSEARFRTTLQQAVDAFQLEVRTF